jgi:DNA primase
VVNQVAETISKINRAEDFTRRQDYIKQVSELLTIAEGGFNTLVNKILRDKIAKDENRSNTFVSNEVPEPINEEADLTSELLFNVDEQNERAMIRSLLEFGNNVWEEGITVADHLFTEIEEHELDTMIETKGLLDILAIYKTWYKEGLMPTDKNFLYHENREISDQVINLMETDTEISPNWKERYEGHIPTRGELFKEEVFSALNYLKLRKIKKMMLENQQELLHAISPEDQMLYLRTHQELKMLEMQLTNQLCTLIYK